MTAGTNDFTESTRSSSAYVRASTASQLDSYLMNVNQKHTFYAVTENCTYRGAVWTSSNPSVATVSQDGGVVTTLAEGQTTISATSYDGGFTASFVLTVDKTTPSGYTVSFIDNDGVYINKADAANGLSFKMSGAEVGSTLSYTVNKTAMTNQNGTYSCNGQVPELFKSGSITVASAEQEVSVGTLKDVSTGVYMDGKYDLNVKLTDAAGNTGPAVTDSIIVDTTPSSNNIIVFYYDYGSEGNGAKRVANFENQSNVQAYWDSDNPEINDIIYYKLTSNDGSTSISGSSVMKFNNYFWIYYDMSKFPDGNIKMDWHVTDIAGNESEEYTYALLKDTSIPTCDLSFGQTVINSSNQTAASFKLDNITDTLWNGCYYTISDSTNSVGDINKYSGTFDSAPTTSATKSGIDLSSLADGQLTLTVKISDLYGNSIIKTATITKDIVAPTVTKTAISNASAASLNLKFSETVAAVTGGTVTISDGTDNYIYKINSVSDPSSTAMIPLTAFKNGDTTLTLDSSKTYSVSISDGAYTDTHGNALAAAKLDKLSIVTHVQSIAISGGTSVTKGNTLQLSATVLPSDATDPSITWSVVNGTGSATISNAGLLTATSAGTVTVTAAAKDVSGVTGTLTVTITAPFSGGSPSSGDTGNTGKTTTNNGTVAASTTVQATTGSNGVASASVTEGQITDALTKAAEEAKKQGAISTELEIKVNASGNATGVSATIPQTAFNSAVSGGIDALTVSSPSVSISFDNTALSEIKSKGTGDINISATRVNTNDLPQADKDKVGNHPVFDLTLTSGGTVISDFGGGSATVSVPYTLAAGEDGNKVVIYYISDSGEMIMVPDCVYDSSTGMVTFKTKHFSKYAVGYNDVAFADVSGWSKDYVNYLSAREIISRMGDGTFNPESNITRAQFVTILAKLSGDDLSVYKTSSFSDVSSGDWYFKVVQWAYENGIAKGADGKFNPNGYITRQDIAAMIARYSAKVMKCTLPQTNSKVTFTDSAAIASYASEAVTAMQQAGIISGSSDGSFSPTANATRAQTAKMVALLAQIVI